MTANQAGGVVRRLADRLLEIPRSLAASMTDRGMEAITGGLAIIGAVRPQVEHHSQLFSGRAK
jgi:hypothetical protein